MSGVALSREMLDEVVRLTNEAERGVRRVDIEPHPGGRCGVVTLHHDRADRGTARSYFVVTAGGKSMEMGA